MTSTVPDPATDVRPAERPQPATTAAEAPAPAAAPGAVERLAVAGHRHLQRASLHTKRWAERAPWLVAVLRAVYYPLAIALVAFMGYQASRRVDFATVRYWALGVGFAAALFWWVALAAGWSVLLTERVQWPPVSAWCRTQVARYVPGGFWAPLARATTVDGRVRDKAAAVLAENVVVLMAALGIGALWVTVHDPRWLPLVVVAGLPFLAARWLERRTKVTRRAVARTTGTYAVGFVGYGVLGILTQVAVSGVHHPTYPLYVAGASCVAWAVGLVVVFAPGGVGVREVVYVWMLHGLYPQAELKAAAVASRLVTVLAELTVLLVVALNDRRRARRLDAAAA